MKSKIPKLSFFLSLLMVLLLTTFNIYETKATWPQTTIDCKWSPYNCDNSTYAHCAVGGPYVDDGEATCWGGREFDALHYCPYKVWCRCVWEDAYTYEWIWSDINYQWCNMNCCKYENGTGTCPCDPCW